MESYILINSIIGKWKFLKLIFNDGCMDDKFHPYICLTDITTKSEYNIIDSCLTVKGQTYKRNNIQRNKVERDEDCVIMLKNETYIYEKELYVVNKDKLEEQKNKFKVVDDNEFKSLLEFCSKKQHHYYNIFKEELEDTYSKYLRNE